MAIEETRVLPSPILEGSLTSFTDFLTKLQGGALPASRMKDFTDPTTGETRKVFKGIDTSRINPKLHLKVLYKRERQLLQQVWVV